MKKKQKDIEFLLELVLFDTTQDIAFFGLLNLGNFALFK